MEKNYRISFYCDLDGIYSNRLFSFDKSTKDEINEVIQKFRRAGNRFRVMYFTELETGEQKKLSKNFIRDLNFTYEAIKQDREYAKLFREKNLTPIPRNSY